MAIDRERQGRAPGRRYSGDGGSSGVAQFASNWTFRIGISPSPAKIAKLFGEAAAEFADYSPAFHRLGPKIVKGIQRVISNRGAGIGASPWPGLRDKYYLDRKSRMGWNRAELYASELLSNSIDIVSIKKRSLKVGTWVPYAKVHQWGHGSGNIMATGKGGKKSMPSRMFMGLDGQAKKDAADELNAEANAILARLGQRIGAAK